LACSSKAIIFRSEKQHVLEMLASGENIVASIDPTIASEFHDISDYRKFVRMLKTLGFRQAYEASFGVDLVAKQYNKLFNSFKGKYYITANCPVVVSYIEKFHPSLVKNLAPIISPMVAMARVIRKKIGNDIKVVHLGPCVGAKDEAKMLATGTGPDAVLTFTELREIFEERNINENALEFSHITEPLGNKGSLYPISNGILQAANISENLLENTVMTGEGKAVMIQYMRAFEQSIDEINTHFNMFFCKGCIIGPGTSRINNRLQRRSMVVEYANKRIKSLNVENWNKNIETYSDIDFERKFEASNQRLNEPNEGKLHEILVSIGMPKREDEVDCGACGYETCRDFAAAVGKGLTISEMCLVHAIKNQQNHIEILKNNNDNLEKIEIALRESEKIARTEHESAKEASETTTAMLQKLRAGVVIINKDLKIIQANQSFINLLGHEASEINEVIPGLVGADIKSLLPYSFYNIITYVINTNEEVVNRDVQLENVLLNISVFPIKKDKIAGAIIRDLYQPLVRKDEIIERVSEVIDKNLQMVQKIGFLLGEGASETEQMLNSILQSFKNDNK
jgi:iron only hydrogenase large subunit-like protein